MKEYLLSVYYVPGTKNTHAHTHAHNTHVRYFLLSRSLYVTRVNNIYRVARKEFFGLGSHKGYRVEPLEQLC